MKKRSMISLLLNCAAFLLLFTTAAFSQKSNVWKGGAPGRAHEWNCPKNWSAARVPDAFTDVVIPDVSSASLASPILLDGVVEVNSLQIGTSGCLTIEKDAQLVVYSIANDFSDMRGLMLRGSILLMDKAIERPSQKNLAVGCQMQ